jgi:hypothetical protein
MSEYSLRLFPVMRAVDFELTWWWTRHTWKHTSKPATCKPTILRDMQVCMNASVETAVQHLQHDCVPQRAPAQYPQRHCRAARRLLRLLGPDLTHRLGTVLSAQCTGRLTGLLTRTGVRLLGCGVRLLGDQLPATPTLPSVKLSQALIFFL